MSAEPKWLIGLKSAARALLLVIGVLAELCRDGIIKDWRLLFSPTVVGTVVTAIITKGGLSAATAKSVTVAGRRRAVGTAEPPCAGSAGQHDVD